MNPHLIIKIGTLGEVEGDAKGFSGGACKVVLESLQNRMAPSATHGVDKPELYDVNHGEIEQHIGGL